MIIWKNKEFREMGVIVEKTPTVSKANKDITIYDIPGRNGFISIDNETYESFPLSVECHLKETADFNKICEWLDGYGTLSLNGKNEYTAVINNSIDFEKVQMFKKFIVQFLVNPIAEDIKYTEYEIGSNNEKLMIDTYTDIYPILEIDCNSSSSITINNETFTISESGTYLLDCKNKIIIKDNENASKYMLGDFPRLFKENKIAYSGDINSFVIKYKKSYLYGG